MASTKSGTISSTYTAVQSGLHLLPAVSLLLQSHPKPIHRSPLMQPLPGDVYHIIREPNHPWLCSFCDEILDGGWNQVIIHVQRHGFFILANEPTPSMLREVTGFGATHGFWVSSR